MTPDSPHASAFVPGFEGQLRVEAANEEDARENVLEEMTFPGTCEITDWEITDARETDPVDEHGRPARARGC